MKSRPFRNAINFLPLVATSFMFALVLASCGPNPGMRLFHVEYRLHSKLVLTTAYDASDQVPVPDLWESLGSPPLFPVSAESSIFSDPAEPLRSELSGDVEVRMVHAGDQLSSARVQRLTFIRQSPDDALWYLPQSEVEILKKMATY